MGVKFSFIFCDVCEAMALASALLEASFGSSI